MTSVQTLINNARIMLSDPDASRYADTTLLYFLNEAVKDITLKAHLLRGVVYIELGADQSIYDVSDKFLKITKAETADGKVIPFKTHDEMDSMSNTWQSHTGDDAKYLVYDRLNQGMFRIYPSVVAGDYVSTSNQIYGIIIDFNLSYTPNYLNITELPLVANYMTIYGITRPDALIITDTNVLGEEWDKAIIHYIVGKALRVGKDTENRSMGNEELALYQAELANANVESASNFARGDRNSQYRGPFHD